VTSVLLCCNTQGVRWIVRGRRVPLRHTHSSSSYPKGKFTVKMSLFTIHGDACLLSCVNAEACLTGWPNAWGRRGGES